MTTDLSTWLTKQEAADRIGVSTKAIERFTRAGKLEQRFRPQAGSPHVAVFYPEDVDKLATARGAAPAPFVLPAGSDLPTNGNGHGSPITPINPLALATAAPPPGEDVLRLLFASALRAVSETSQTPSLFVTIREAAAVTGLSQACVRRLIADGTLKAIRDRGWRIRRKDLEAL